MRTANRIRKPPVFHDRPAKSVTLCLLQSPGNCPEIAAFTLAVKHFTNGVDGGTRTAVTEFYQFSVGVEVVRLYLL